MASTNNITVKCVLVGDGAVGKSTFIKRHLTGEYELKYIATLGVEVYPLKFYTQWSDGTLGNITFNMWDCAGQEKFAGLSDGYYIGADAAIVMFDLTSRPTFANVPKRMIDVHRVVDNIPVALCGNKADMPDRKVSNKNITDVVAKIETAERDDKTRMWPEFHYYDISAKSNYQFELPFLFLARSLCKDQGLVFTEQPGSVPVEVTVPVNLHQQYEQEFGFTAGSADDSEDPDEE